MLGVLAFSHFMMLVALTLLKLPMLGPGFSEICLWIGEGNREKRKEESQRISSLEWNLG